MVKKAQEKLKELHLRIKSEFFFKSDIDAPLLRGMEILLKSIDKNGLKLTQAGFLPTKVVKEIMLNAHTPVEEQFLKLEKRFYEAENLSASMARILCQNLSLIKVQKGKLYLTRAGKKFLTLTTPERYIVLFADMFRLNQAYFDYFEEAPCVYESTIVLLQLIRDKERCFRDVDEYVQILLKEYPSIEERLDECIVEEDDPYRAYVTIVETRLFERFYLPLGLIDIEMGERYLDTKKYAKSKLLETLLEPVNEVNKEMVLNKKTIRQYQEWIKANKLDIDLFEVLMFLFVQFAPYPLPPKEVVIDMLIQKHKVIGTLEGMYRDFYENLIQSVIETINQYTQYEAINANDYLKKQYFELLDALASLVSSPKPFVTVKKISFVPMVFFDFLQAVLKIDPNDPDFLNRCEEKLGNEFVEDLSMFIMSHKELENLGKKLKKPKPAFINALKEFITAYLVVIFELRTIA